MNPDDPQRTNPDELHGLILTMAPHGGVAADLHRRRGHTALHALRHGEVAELPAFLREAQVPSRQGRRTAPGW